MGGQVSIVTRDSQGPEQTSDHRNSYAAVVKTQDSWKLQEQGKSAFERVDCSKKVPKKRTNFNLALGP